MADETTHRFLVYGLVETIARNHGEVTHAVGVGVLSDPPRIGRHEPDAIARDAMSGRLLIGEAKRGDELFTEHSQEQLADFSTHIEESGEHASFVLAVPQGWRIEAERAITEAGGDLEWTNVLEVDFPDAPPAPLPGE
jgi:hypothetical protein